MKKKITDLAKKEPIESINNFKTSNGFPKTLKINVTNDLDLNVLFSRIGKVKDAKFISEKE